MEGIGALTIDCSAGARKDSIPAQLFQMLDDAEREEFLSTFSHIGIPSAEAICETDDEGALSFAIAIDGVLEKDAPHQHMHRTPDEVAQIVSSLDIPDGVKDDALGIYAILAQAEAKAHGASVDDVHFHEVGNDYAIASIVATCMLMAMLAPDSIEATPIAAGNGFVDCAHGRLAIPAPATANILEGMPWNHGDAEGELCTPTGAAIVRYFAWDNR